MGFKSVTGSTSAHSLRVFDTYLSNYKSFLLSSFRKAWQKSLVTLNNYMLKVLHMDLIHLFFIYFIIKMPSSKMIQDFALEESQTNRGYGY